MKIRTACNRDCPDACGVLATVEHGRVVRLEGDPDHPVTRGFLCYRTNQFLSRQYDPARLTEPRLRRGAGWTTLSWEAALDLAAERLRRVRDESGGAAILHYRSGGSLGLMKHVTDYFFERFGPVTIKTGDICSGAGDAAQMADFGECDSHDLFDLEHSRTIVVWGKNPFISNIHLVPLLKQARERGAHLVQIDPVHHRGAELAELSLQPRPGGDIALALGVARRLFEWKRVDPDAASYCDHLEDFGELVHSRHPEDWAGEADVPVEQLDRLAELYAEGPSTILVGWGMQRRTQGSATIRALDALCAVSGNLGVAGGGVSFYFKRRGAFDLSFVSGEAVAPRVIPEPLLGPGILEADDPPIRLAWITGANPVAMLPESRTVARALSSREFTVVVDSFLTDTAQCADLVLPTTTMLEDDDLVGAFGHHWLSELRPVVAPPGEVLTDYGITQELARRLDLADEFSGTVEDWKRRLLSRVAGQGASLEALRERPVRNPESARVLFADRKFNTPSGRVQLVHELNLEPPPTTTERPLWLTAVPTPKAQASQWVSRNGGGPARAVVHPASAAGFDDGDPAEVESEVGSVTVRLQFDGNQRRDVLLMDKGGWLADGQCANALVRARQTDAGGCAVYYDTPVRLRRPG